MAHWSIIALAGPKADIWNMKKAFDAEKMFDDIVLVDVPDDYGEFPDTTGYTAENWEDIILDQEDGNLYGYMTKCMDACLDFTNKRADQADKLGLIDIQKNVHWPKFGGAVFAVTGHVTAEQPMPTLMFSRMGSLN